MRQKVFASENVLEKVCCDAKSPGELLWHCSTHVQHGGSVALSVGHLKLSVPLSTKQLETVLRIMRQPCGSTGQFDLIVMHRAPHVSDLRRGGTDGTVKKFQIIAGVLNNVRSNRASLSKETATVEKSVSLSAEQEMFHSHSWLTNTTSVRGCETNQRYSRVKHHPSPPPSSTSSMAASGSSRRWGRASLCQLRYKINTQ